MKWLAKILTWARNIFQRPDNAPTTHRHASPTTISPNASTHVAQSESELRVPIATKTRVRRQRTIGQLLDNLDVHFERLYRKKDVKGWEYCHWNVRRALRKMGPFVPPPGYTVQSDKIHHGHRPSLMFFANDPSFQSNETDNIAFVYAMKQKKKKTWFLERHGDGDIYEIGIATQDRVTQGKLLWATYDIEIVGDQAVPLKRLYSHRVDIPNKGGSYMAKTWRYSVFPIDNDQKTVALYAHSIFNFWLAKTEMWHIVAKKDGKRMTFCVPTRDTKHYFKDRDEVFVDGVKKRIIHYVRAHTRQTANGDQHVREHIRGLRQFSWHDYDINVKTPKIGGGLIFDDLDIKPAEDEATGILLSPAEMVTEMVWLDDIRQPNLSETER